MARNAGRIMEGRGTEKGIDFMEHGRGSGEIFIGKGDLPPEAREKMQNLKSFVFSQTLVFENPPGFENRPPFQAPQYSQNSFLKYSSQYAIIGMSFENMF
jgi:hypothetical protein